MNNPLRVSTETIKIDGEAQSCVVIRPPEGQGWDYQAQCKELEKLNRHLKDSTHRMLSVKSLRKGDDMLYIVCSEQIEELEQFVSRVAGTSPRRQDNAPRNSGRSRRPKRLIVPKVLRKTSRSSSSTSRRRR